MDVINRSFAPHNISFALVSTDRIVSQYWASGLGELRMMWDSNRGDGRTLNLYFIERFVENATQSGLAYPPHRLTVDPGAYRIDSVIITASTVPGGPADRAAFKGMMAVRGIGVWLGLLNDLPGDCDDAAQVQSRLCHTEFTPDQARRMHENWNKYRAPHRVPTQALLAPMEPVEKKDKRAYYPDPVSKIAAMVECLPHEINVTRETRESYCGSFIYCYFGTWKAAGKGEKYNGPNPGQQCFEERAAPESFMVDVLDSARVPSTGTMSGAVRRGWPFDNEGFREPGVADKFSSLWASFEGGGYPF